MATSKKPTAPARMLTGGVLMILAACWFWFWLVKNPFDELALIRRAQVASGSLVDTLEDEAEDSRGKVRSVDIGVYAYRLPDGREFKTTKRVPAGELRDYQEIEYLPDNPAVSRVKGDGCRSITEWLWRKVGLGTLVLAVFLAPGFIQLRDAIRDMKRLHTST